MAFLTIERKTEIHNVVNQEGMLGPISVFFTVALLHDIYILRIGSFKSLHHQAFIKNLIG